MAASSANDRQHGGDHYRRKGGYQHWDWVHDLRLSYHAGCASKYASRWRDKGVPVEDLEKAIHYVDKAQELGITGSTRTDRQDKFWEFVLSQNIPSVDAPALYYIMEGDWDKARECLRATLDAFLKQS